MYSLYSLSSCCRCQHPDSQQCCRKFAGRGSSVDACQVMVQESVWFYDRDSAPVSPQGRYKLPFESQAVDVYLFHGLSVREIGRSDFNFPRFGEARRMYAECFVLGIREFFASPANATHSRQTSHHGHFKLALSSNNVFVMMWLFDTHQRAQ